MMMRMVTTHASSIKEDRENTKTQMNAVPPQHTHIETSA